MPDVAEKVKCPACKGSTLMSFGIGMAKCSACGGTGLSARYRRERAVKNKMVRQFEYDRRVQEIDEVKAARDQFKVTSNLDGVIKQVLEDHIWNLELQLIQYAPRRKRPDYSKIRL